MRPSDRFFQIEEKLLKLHNLPLVNFFFFPNISWITSQTGGHTHNKKGKRPLLQLSFGSLTVGFIIFPRNALLKT